MVHALFTQPGTCSSVADCVNVQTGTPPCKPMVALYPACLSAKRQEIERRGALPEAMTHPFCTLLNTRCYDDGTNGSANCCTTPH